MAEVCEASNDIDDYIDYSNVVFFAKVMREYVETLLKDYEHLAVSGFKNGGGFHIYNTDLTTNEALHCISVSMVIGQNMELMCFGKPWNYLGTLFPFYEVSSDDEELYENHRSFEYCEIDSLGKQVLCCLRFFHVIS